MTEWIKGNELQTRGGDLGGTMPRLGAYPAHLARGSRIANIRTTEISERHRHRYEVNTRYKGSLEQHGMRFSGMSPDGILRRRSEFRIIPWFVVPFHPELKSRPFAPHPLFSSFIEAAISPDQAGVVALGFSSDGSGSQISRTRHCEAPTGPARSAGPMTGSAPKQSRAQCCGPWIASLRSQ